MNLESTRELLKEISWDKLENIHKLHSLLINANHGFRGN
jgi:hypothetical protein